MQVPEFIVSLPDGRTESCTTLAVRFFDDAIMRQAGATVVPLVARNGRPLQMLPVPPRHILLWVNDDYDAAGDYTQAQVEARVLEVLGDLTVAFSPV